MSRYARYLLMLTGRKVSTYLIPLMFILTFGITVIIQSTMNESPNPAITQLLNYFYLFPFVFGPLYVATKAVNIFKDGEQDGTELMIVSKRITRKKVVMAKFIALYTHIFMFTLFVFISVSLISLADSHASSIQRIRFSGSMTVGVLIVNILMSAIITFIASYVGRIGTMTSAILIPFVFSITSFILAPLGKGSIKTPSTTTNYIVTQHNLKTGTHSDHVGHAYGTDATKLAIEDQKTGFYKYASYLDVYKQLTSFYTMFQDRDASLANVNKWTEHVNQWKSDRTYKIDPLTVGLPGFDQNSSYVSSNLVFSPIIEDKVSQNEVAKALKIMDQYIENNTADFINEVVRFIVGRKYEKFSQEIVREAVSKLITDGTIAGLKDAKPVVTDKAKTYAWVKILTNDIKKKQAKPLANQIFDRSKSVIGTTFKFDFTKTRIQNIQGLYMEGEDYSTYTPKPWVNNNIKYVLWIILALALSVVVVFRYLKRDFK